MAYELIGEGGGHKFQGRTSERDSSHDDASWCFFVFRHGFGPAWRGSSRSRRSCRGSLPCLHAQMRGAGRPCCRHSRERPSHLPRSCCLHPQGCSRRRRRHHPACQPSCEQSGGGGGQAEAAAAEEEEEAAEDEPEEEEAAAVAEAADECEDKSEAATSCSI